MSKNGKRLTRTQRNILLNNGIDDVSDWVYIKQETVDSAGHKSAALNRGKTTFMIVSNVVTGETRRFEIS